ncbi:MAG: isoprenylcysteine carboxylmethyltransferase family protein [Epulopiscium sp.]|nr:isoprenylcysteine carboxylmethyltransferase family protein [Candidatus Epulonipiscium sp.]
MVRVFYLIFFANKEIGKNCSASIEKDKEQKLVTSGIYRYIRHPLYLSGIFMGTVIYFQSWLSSLLLFPCLLMIGWNLILLFIDQYTEYMKRTNKMITFLY